MKKAIFIIFAFVIMLSSCERNQKFSIIGHVDDSVGETIYLEKININDIIKIDSTQISTKGHFKLKSYRPSEPNFFRLRIKDRFIVFAVDSTEKIVIDSEHPEKMIYTITGSDNIDKISFLRKSANNIENLLDNNVSKVNEKKNFERKDIENTVNAINEHREAAKNIIINNPQSTAAYYALFQQVDNMFIFDILDDADLTLFQMVATAFNANYPHSLRSKHLTSLVLQTKHNKRTQELRHLILKEQNRTPLPVNIALPNYKNEIIKLNDYLGKVILLDFCYMDKNHTIEHIFSFFKLYYRFNPEDFVIYTISFDKNNDAFRTISQYLPWNRVYDQAGSSSNLIKDFGVEALPTLFIIDKKGKIISYQHVIDNNLINLIEQLLTE